MFASFPPQGVNFNEEIHFIDPAGGNCDVPAAAAAARIELLKIKKVELKPADRS